MNNFTDIYSKIDQQNEYESIYGDSVELTDFERDFLNNLEEYNATNNRQSN